MVMKTGLAALLLIWITISLLVHACTGMPTSINKRSADDCTNQSNNIVGKIKAMNNLMVSGVMILLYTLCMNIQVNCMSNMDLLLVM